MSARLGLAVGLCGVAGAIAALLVAWEARLEPPPLASPVRPVLPPTWGQSYGPDQRRGVLEALGARGAVLEGALDRAGQLLERRSELEGVLSRVEDATLVADALCADALPVPYRAGLLVLDGPAGAVVVRSPLSPAFGTRWEGVTAQQVASLYETWELHPARRDEDALLALAALALGRVDDAVDPVRRAPWHERAVDGNHLERVAGIHPEAPVRLADYLGTAIALAEVVAATPAAWGCEEAL